MKDVGNVKRQWSNEKWKKIQTEIIKVTCLTVQKWDTSESEPLWPDLQATDVKVRLTLHPGSIAIDRSRAGDGNELGRKVHLPLFCFFCCHYCWFWILSLWNLVLFVIWILSLWNLVLFVIWILSLWKPCPKYFSLPFNSCPSQHPWHCESFYFISALTLKCIGSLNVLDYNHKEGEMVRVEGFGF